MKNSSKLLIDESPLQVLPSLALALGLNEAIVLQQIHYWLNNKNSGVDKDGFHWIYNTYEDWKVQFPFWSTATIKRIFTSLKEQGVIIIEQFRKNTWDWTNYYRINYEKLEEVSYSDGSTCAIPSDQVDPSDGVKLTPSLLTETTAENSQKITNTQKGGGGSDFSNMPPKLSEQDLPALSDIYCTESHQNVYNLPKWIRACQEMTANKVTPEVLRKTIKHMRENNLTFTGPWSCVGIAIQIASGNIQVRQPVQVIDGDNHGIFDDT